MRIKGKWFCILALGISILTIPCAWAAVAEDDFARGVGPLEKVCAYVVLYDKLGQKQKSLALLLPDEKKIRQIIGISTALTAEVRIILAEHYAASGRYAQAIQVAEEILPVAEYLFGPQEPRTKRLLAALDQAYTQSGKTAEAEKMGQEAAAAVKKTREELRPKLAQGKAYLQKKDYSQAIMTLSEVYRYLEDNHLLFTDEGSAAMANLIDAYRALDQADKAREISKNGLRISAQYYGLEDGATINMADQYARGGIRLGDTKTAIDTAEKYLPYRIKFFGWQAEETVSLKLLLGTALADDRQYAGALKTLRQNLMAIHEVYGHESAEMVRAFSYMGMSYAGLGRGEEAVQSAREALEISLKLTGPRSDATLETMLELSRSYIQTGRYLQAIEVLETALERAEKAPGPPDKDSMALRQALKAAKSSFPDK